MYTPDRKILGGRTAHSLYFTLLPELGTLGVVVFSGLLITLCRRCVAMRARAGPSAASSGHELSSDRIKFDLLAKAMLSSLVAYMVTGAFITVLYYPPFWHLVGMCAATYGVWKTTFAAPVAAPTKPRRFASLVRRRVR
jgi:O-antigen ligase